MTSSGSRTTSRVSEVENPDEGLKRAGGRRAESPGVSEVENPDEGLKHYYPRPCLLVFAVSEVENPDEGLKRESVGRDGSGGGRSQK